MKTAAAPGPRRALSTSLAAPALALTLTLALAPASPLQGAASARILLIAGKPSHPAGMHEFRAGCLLLQKCLEGIPNVSVQVASNGWPTRVVGGQVVDDPTAFDEVRAVFVYCDGGGGHPAIVPERLKLLDSLAARGVGLGFAHYAVEVPRGDPSEAMQRWIGGNYEDRYSVNPMWSPEYAAFPEHPVTRGVRPFSNRDEWYFNMRWAGATNGLTGILVATPSDAVRKGPYVWPAGPYEHVIAASGRPETMMWVLERPDGGRGFGFTGGHTHANWGDPNQRKVVLNAILWMAQVDVPAGGVDSIVAPGDLQQNLDPKER
ncbi:MAG: ThuA domain-containing protein [Verrucomicrobiae bacterium]|nr:ThuA domain-containing protein [Verrucomicrobiae bacterium]